MANMTIKANRVGINFGWEAHVKQGRKVLGSTGTHATKEAAIEAAKDLAARKGWK
jgi:hypothetical protein